ncbi:MAG: RDD family protein [Microbacteriaceae bacterium]|nr:RDD family protein [Microbacteriaceae bacterium]
MADDDLVTGDAVAVDLRPASFALRAASTIIDFVATLAVGAGAIWLLMNATSGIDQATTTALVVIVAVVCLVVLPALVETLSRGKSLGRLALGVRIVRDDGGAITFRHAFIRALVGVLELFMTVGGTAAVTGLLSPRTKRLGDLLAGTYAMHERVAQPAPFAMPVPPPLAEWARIADAARLPDALARRIAAFLRQAPSMDPRSRAVVAQSLAAEAARYAHPVPAAPAEDFLIGVAALRRDREANALARQAVVIARLEPVLEAARRGVPERG